mgnify:CR=1 FL=1
MHDEALSGGSWHLNSYLLLDGISVEALPRKIYEWSDSPEYEVLYLETPWVELSDVSPFLVKLHGKNDAILNEFLANQSQEWGYLIFSSKESEEVVQHLRKLISVEHPLGQSMLLRLADPAVANALFGLAADSEQWGRVHQLADQAYQTGFTSERDIALYANVFGFLGWDVLERHPDIAELVTRVGPQSPSQRIEHAANLAESRVALLERNPV